MRRLITRRPSAPVSWLLAALPFVLLAGAYLIASAGRPADNSTIFGVPSLAAIGEAIEQVATATEPPGGDIILWVDTPRPA